MALRGIRPGAEILPAQPGWPTGFQSGKTTVAPSPQYTRQIMETQSRFDLNHALAAWRQELAAQPAISLEQARELETHLLDALPDRKSTRLNSSHLVISYAVFCLKKKKTVSTRDHYL